VADGASASAVVDASRAARSMARPPLACTSSIHTPAHGGRAWLATVLHIMKLEIEEHVETALDHQSHRLGPAMKNSCRP
jgi:hypothetical protein